MRGYFGTTASELQDFIDEGSLDVSELYAATPDFMATHRDSDEEELEFILSLLAAEDALDFHKEDSTSAIVVACEIGDELIDRYGELTIELTRPIMWTSVEAVFTVGEDAEDLTWYAPQEVPLAINSWM